MDDWGHETDPAGAAPTPDALEPTTVEIGGANGGAGYEPIPCDRHPQFYVAKNGVCPECADEKEWRRNQQTKADEREFQLRRIAQSGVESTKLAKIWAPVLAAFLLGLMFMIGYIVHEVTSSRADRERARQNGRANVVDVWCYADPNSDRATSHFTGTAGSLRNICPVNTNPY